MVVIGTTVLIVVVVIAGVGGPLGGQCLKQKGTGESASGLEGTMQH